MTEQLTMHTHMLIASKKLTTGYKGQWPLRENGQVRWALTLPQMTPWRTFSPCWEGKLRKRPVVSLQCKKPKCSGITGHDKDSIGQTELGRSVDKVLRWILNSIGIRGNYPQSGEKPLKLLETTVPSTHKGPRRVTVSNSQSGQPHNLQGIS